MLHSNSKTNAESAWPLKIVRLDFNIIYLFMSSFTNCIHSSRWKIMTYYFMSLEKLVRNMIFIYPLVWWKLGCISLLNIPWFMSWLYLSPALIVRFLKDKTKRSVTLECKIWHLQDFFSSLSILWPYCAVNLIQRKHQKTYLSANLFFSEVYYVDMMGPYISLDFKTSSSFFTIHTQGSNIFCCIHESIIHGFNKLY